MKKKTALTGVMAIVLCACPTFAQNTVDLSAQRHEIQTWTDVPGEKINHKGIILNPTPHHVTRTDKQAFNFLIPGGFSYSPKGSPDYTQTLTDSKVPLNPNGPVLSINVTPKNFGKKGSTPAKSGAYEISISKKGVAINAYDDRGAFYAIQTLRQLVDSSIRYGEGCMSELIVKDYPDLPYRGVVEGFYGNPWSHTVRLSLIDFMGRNKMNNYIYGPKDDPYHSSPNWRIPYPEKEAVQIKELADACRKSRVDFIWAIHPGGDIKWNEEDYKLLLDKFESMYNLGVRGFAVFFDDIQGAGANSQMQCKLLNDLTRDFVEKKGDVSNIMVCPTDYNQSWAGKSENSQLAVYGRELDKNVEVFWTGAKVCSDIEPKSLEFVDSRIKRPALIWWNFPVSDYCRNLLLEGPVYGLDPNLTTEQLCGVESNPMEYGEASKLAIYGVADYTWNMKDYNPIDNWERGLAELASEDPEAYRIFAIHATDTEKGYRRAESWETETFNFDNYTETQFNALKKEFQDITSVPSRMQLISNRPLVNELNPWLEEFGKLGNRGLKTLELIKIYEKGKDVDFWNAWNDNLMSKNDSALYNAHKSGTMKLQPFYINNMSRMLDSWYAKISDGAKDNGNVTCLDLSEAFDNNPRTSVAIEDVAVFNRIPDAENITLLVTPAIGNVSLLQRDSTGKVVTSDNLKASILTLKIHPETKSFELRGRTDLHEAIQK